MSTPTQILGVKHVADSNIMSTPTQILGVKRVAGSTIRDYWCKSVDVVTTDKGEFLAFINQDFSNFVGEHPPSYFTTYEDINFIWRGN